MPDTGNNFDSAEVSLGPDDRLRQAEAASGIGTFDMDLENGHWDWGPQIAALFGSDPGGDDEAFASCERLIFVDDVPKLRAAFAEAKRSGGSHVEFRVRHPDGSLHWLALKGRTLPDRPSAFRGAIFEITERKGMEARLLALNETLEARVAQVREEARALEVLNRTGIAVAAELDLERLVQMVTDAGVELSHAAFGAFFYNVIKAGGEAYTLYTLSGAPRSAFEKFPMPRNTAVFEPTFRGRGPVRSDDILKDPRYGKSAPYHGMPKGHLPVRSYLAVPVISRSGEVLGGLFFGHASPGVFTSRAEQIVTSLAAQAAVAIDNSRLRRLTGNVMQGARRAESLTQRLLAFSRQQPLDPKPIDIGRLVSGMSDLLRRTLGEQVTVETVLGGGVWRALADPNQLELAILNLAVNARDAMPEGGKLTIETTNVHLDDQYAAGQIEVIPGQYVMLAVTDTGTGMTEDVMAKAFDPFFTTKDVGYGTGLGLSQVYGFVKQSRGHVKIYSEPGYGTTIKIYLPRLLAQGDEKETETDQEIARGSSAETILLVEDDEGVRNYGSETLRELGYRVLEAADGRAGLDLLARHPEIRLLFTDIGLPGGMNGRQFADEARKRRKTLRVLFTTAYARNAIVHDGRLDPGVALLPKPYTQSALATKVRDILDARRSPWRILLVEDEPLIQMLAIEYLEEAGFNVDAAGSAAEAMNKLALIPGGVDAAIVDMGLPDRKGDVLIREMRTLHPTLPVIIATGQGADSLRDIFKGESNFGFVQKPYSASSLLGALRSLGVPTHLADC